MFLLLSYNLATFDNPVTPTGLGVDYHHFSIILPPFQGSLSIILLLSPQAQVTDLRQLGERCYAERGLGLKVTLHFYNPITLQGFTVILRLSRVGNCFVFIPCVAFIPFPLFIPLLLARVWKSVPTEGLLMNKWFCI